MGVKVYGIEKLEMADWIEAVDFKMSEGPKPSYEKVPELNEKEKQTTAKLMRDTINEIDKKYNINRPQKRFYTDRTTGEKIYYSELPPNWKANLTSDWRRSDRIKSDIRRRDKKK